MDWITAPLDYVIGMFDLVDLVVIGLIVTFGIGYYFNSRSALTNAKPTIISRTDPKTSNQHVDRSFYGRMKSEDRQVFHRIFMRKNLAKITGFDSFWISNGNR